MSHFVYRYRTKLEIVIGLLLSFCLHPGCIFNFVSSETDHFVLKTNCFFDLFNSATFGSNKSFDFSKFNEKRWWNTTNGKAISGYMLHFSFCLPNELSPCTKKESLACLSKLWKGDSVEEVHDAGSYVSGFSLVDNVVLLTLTGTEKCSAGYYSTVFQIKCSNIESFQPVSVEHGCKHVLAWEHPAACPISNNDLEKNCIFEVSGHKFDLWPLKQMHIVRKGKKDKHKDFELSICGKDETNKCGDSDVAVCEIQQNRTISSVSNNKTRVVFEDHTLVLQYLNNADDIQAEIKFICAKEIHGQNRLEMPIKDHMVFLVFTSLACESAVQREHLIFNNNDNSYDFDFFCAENRTYEINNSQKNLKYFVNFCGQPRQRVCSGMICLQDMLTNNTISLGSKVLPPVIEDEFAIFEFFGGDYCVFGGTNKALFKLKCHPREEQPEFIGYVTENCTHIFVWNTPLACPFQYAKGDYCSVEEKSFYADNYDLKSVQSSTGNYKITQGKDTFEMNICAPLNNPNSCGSAEKPGICWTRVGQTHVVIGYYSEDLEFFNGHVSLTMLGDQCKPGSNASQAVVSFKCDWDSKKTVTPYLQSMDLDECHFHFIFPTKSACDKYSQQYVSNECSTEDAYNNTYNLSPLTRRNSNYVIKLKENGDEVILLNVCQPVVPGFGVMCPAMSEVCLFRSGQSVLDKRPEFLNLGESPSMNDVNGPVVQDGLIQIQYVSQLCSSSSILSTIIFFICSQQDKMSEPDPYLIDVSQCKFRFIWRSKLACPASKNLNENLPCTVQNENDDWRIDLRPLMVEEYSIQTSTRDEFKFAVCRDLNQKTCEKSGSCLLQKEISVSTGIANSFPQYNPGAVTLTYKNGSECEKGRAYTTVIRFTCNTNTTSSQPEIIQFNDNCTFFINWETKLACERKINCEATSNSKKYTLDLSPLMANNNYHVDFKGERIFINVCRPLKVTSNVICAAGSASCIGNLLNTEMKSLGYFTEQPSIEANDSVWLRYNGGSQCDGNHTQNYSTAINFICDLNTNIGKPTIRAVHNCQYVFEWKTRYACPDKTLIFNTEQCEIYDKESKTITELRALGIVLTTSVMGNKYRLDLCSHNFLSRIVGGTWLAVGKPEAVVFDYIDNAIVFKIRNGSKCSKTEFFVAEVRLRCDPLQSVESKPYVQMESMCAIYIKWDNLAFCNGKKPITTEIQVSDVTHPPVQVTDVVNKDIIVPAITQSPVPETATSMAVPETATKTSVPKTHTPLPVKTRLADKNFTSVKIASDMSFPEDSNSITPLVLIIILLAGGLFIIVIVAVIYIIKKMKTIPLSSDSRESIPLFTMPSSSYNRHSSRPEEKAKIT